MTGTAVATVGWVVKVEADEADIVRSRLVSGVVVGANVEADERSGVGTEAVMVVTATGGGGRLACRSRPQAAMKTGRLSNREKADRRRIAISEYIRPVTAL
jgi:hypothetical protein